MIKIFKNVYIHWLTVILFVFGYITKRLEFLSLMYFVMILHELAHALAAKFLKLGISKIILYPFGLNVSVRTRVLCSLSDSIILYFSGPAINAFLAILAQSLGYRGMFVYNNIVIFILNMLPIIPLDGGRIAEALLLKLFKVRTCRIILNITTIIISLIIACLIIYFGEFNINSLTFTAFIAGSCILTKPKYNRDYLREFLFVENKKKKSAQMIMVNEDINSREIINEFSPRKHTLVIYLDADGNIVQAKSDKKVIFDIIYR